MTPSTTSLIIVAAERQDPRRFDLKHIFSPDFWTKLLEDSGARALHAIAQILFIIILYLVARMFLSRIISRAVEMMAARQDAAGRTGATRARTLGCLLKSVLSYVLIFIASFMVLGVLGLDRVLAPVLTAAGVVGLAVGFGAQKLVKDVISGFFILLENQYAVGEYVTVGAITGIVEDLELRTTRIRDDSGKLTFVSNGDITIVTNHSRGPILTSIEVGVAPGTDLDRACKILRELGEEFADGRKGVLGPFTCDGVAAMDGTKVTLRLVGRIDPTVQQEVQLELRKRVRDALLQNEMSIA